MKTSRTFVEPAFIDSPERTYTGFDHSVCTQGSKGAYRIAIVTTPRQVFVCDLFALDYDVNDETVYESACKELARYCDDEELLIVGFYTEIRKGEK